MRPSCWWKERQCTGSFLVSETTADNQAESPAETDLAGVLHRQMFPRQSVFWGYAGQTTTSRFEFEQ